MTLEVGLVLGILGVAIVLFITEIISVDLVALLVLVSLPVCGLVTPDEALSGFSSPAVVTIWAMFILSGAITRTGLATKAGNIIHKLAGDSLVRLILVIMLVSGAMSAFMNNVGVAAMLLPVVMDLARRGNHAPSKLLIPLAFATLLGGIITMIGTPSNILLTDIMADYGIEPFKMFDYAPLGIAALLTGTIFVTLIGHRLLPERFPTRDFASGKTPDMRDAYDLMERMFTVFVPEDSELDGKTLRESKLGSVLGLTVIGILHNGNRNLAPTPDTILKSGDRLLVEGRTDPVAELAKSRNMVLLKEGVKFDELITKEVNLVEVSLSPDSKFLGKCLCEIKFRSQFGVNVLAIWRKNRMYRAKLQYRPIKSGDTLLVQGTNQNIEKLRKDENFLVSTPESANIYQLQERLLLIKIPDESMLIGKTLAECHLGDAYELMVLAVTREGKTKMMVSPDEKLQAGDVLLAEGKPEDFKSILGLHSLEIDEEPTPTLDKLETSRVGLEEVVLSPHSDLAGQTLRDLHFREKFGLSVLAIWRGGRAYRSNLRDMKLQFGDALLLFGPREKLSILNSESDFLVLTEKSQEEPRSKKALLSGLIMIASVLPAVVGWIPISISAIIGSVLMVLTGCLTMGEAYRYIEWKAVFLIAGMLPMGIAMENTGAASMMANGLVSSIGVLGPYAAIAIIYLVANIATQFLPNPVVAVLIAPVAFNAANSLHISPYAMLMVLAVSVSISLMTPVAHASNVIVMGPGAYRFSDYIKIGLPISILVLIATMMLIGIVFPL